MTLFLLLSRALAFESVTETVGGGVVDWTNMRLVAKAVGRSRTGAITSLEALEGDARSQLGPAMADLARRVRFDGDHSVARWLDAGDAVADRLEGNLQRWEVYEARYLTSGGVELDAALSMTSWLRPARVTLAKSPEVSSTSASVSGVVVDARGLTVKCSVSPKLVDGAGGHLYGIADMTQYASSLRGPVVYVRDPADPVAAKRVGDSPLFVTATEVQHDVDLVIESDDAVALRDAAKESGFLRDGMVVIVVGP